MSLTQNREYPVFGMEENTGTFLSFRTSVAGTEATSAIVKIDADIGELYGRVEELEANGCTVKNITFEFDDNDNYYHGGEGELDPNSMLIFAINDKSVTVETNLKFGDMPVKPVVRTKLSSGGLISMHNSYLIVGRPYLAYYDGVQFILVGCVVNEGDADEMTVNFTETDVKENISVKDNMRTLFGKISKWYSSFGALAWKSKIAADDIDTDGTVREDIRETIGAAAAEHSHDDSYAPAVHNHDDVYAKSTHTHEGVYAPAEHTHEYAAKNHNHEGVYATKGHTHTAEVIGALPITGGTMEGDLDITGYSLTVAEPEEDNEAANKKYVDDKVLDISCETIGAAKAVHTHTAASIGAQEIPVLKDNDSVPSMILEIENNAEYDYTNITQLTIKGNMNSAHGFITFGSTTPGVEYDTSAKFIAALGDDITTAAINEVWEFDTLNGRIIWKNWGVPA